MSWDSNCEYGHNGSRNQYTGLLKWLAGEQNCYAATFQNDQGFPLPVSWISGFRFSIISQQTFQEVAYGNQNVSNASSGQIFILLNSVAFTSLPRGAYYYAFYLYDMAGNRQTMERGVLKLI